MAEVAGEGTAAFWSRDVSDEEQPAVYIPGLCTDGNLRLPSRFKSAKPEDRRAGGAAPTPVTTMDLPQDWPQHRPPQEEAPGEAGNRSASLKDLCPEDKRRIANLIKELARVSEEKEVTEERLKIEHESFEKKIRHLEEQNNLIATEREALQQQYRECQELLSLYQKYLSEQQEKLNRSLSDLGARSVQPQQVPKRRQEPSEGELSGSYLGDLESLSCVAPPPFCRSDPPPRCGFHCKADRSPSRRKCCSVAGATQCRLCASTALNPARCCLHPAPHSTPEPPPLPRPAEDRSAALALTNEVTAPRRDSATSERRKHELMLQKMELEVEKERLQQLLEQQEAKLLEKQRELEPDRSPVAIHTTEAAVGTTPSLGTAVALSPARGSPVGLSTPPSSKIGKKARSPGGAYSGGKAAKIDTNHQRDMLLRGTDCRGSVRDAAVSPAAAGLRAEMKSTNASPDHKDVLRYETSLIDMLEAISPISFQRQHKHYTNPYDLNILQHSPPRGQSKPPRQSALPRRPNPPTVDPEESRILEDIFFIL